MVTNLTPNAYLASPVQRRTHGIKMWWSVVETSIGTGTDNAGLGAQTKTYFAIDVVPNFSSTKSSELTEFPVQDGTTYSDHIIHFPEVLTLDVVQTNTPFEDVEPQSGDVVDFASADMELSVPQTRFVPRGLLLLSLMADEGIRTGLSELGLPVAVSPTGVNRVSVVKPPNPRDRVNELVDALDQVRLAGHAVGIQWFGQRWTEFRITEITYSRKFGKGNIQLKLKRLDYTSTETVALPAPAEPRLKPEVKGGHQPARKVTPAEKRTIQQQPESVGHAGATELGVI